MTTGKSLVPRPVPFEGRGALIALGLGSRVRV